MASTRCGELSHFFLLRGVGVVIYLSEEGEGKIMLGIARAFLRVSVSDSIDSFSCTGEEPVLFPLPPLKEAVGEGQSKHPRSDFQ